MVYIYIPKGKILTEISIRIDKPKNNQKKGIRLADDYNFERQISILLKEES